MASIDLYEEVSAKIIAELEAGAAPWVKPWSVTAGNNVPCNGATNRPYSGVNVVLLWMVGQAYPTPRYLTYKQAFELGGHVRRGERGHTVVFMKPAIKKGDTPDDDKTYLLMRSYTVFNVAQCEGLSERMFQAGPVTVRNQDERDATIDEFLSSIGANIQHGGNSAFYRPSTDYINLPAFKAFDSAANYYVTAFHELCHWTGHKSRQDRDLRGRFGEKAYAAEELIAELGAAFLCAEFGIDGNLRHAGYIASWVKLLKDDSRAFFSAAAKAQQAADYLRSMVLAEGEKAAA